MNPGIYIALASVAVLGVMFFFLMRSIDKKLADVKSKSKKKRR